MKILYVVILLVCIPDVIGSTEEKELFSFSLYDIFLCVGFSLGGLFAFGIGGSHEWHLTMQDQRIDSGELKNTQRHQLLAGFKDRAVVWSGIIGTFLAILTTQVEHLSEKLQFTYIMSGVLVVMGPYLLGRLTFIFYLHGSAYRKAKTLATSNYLPFYFMNISILVFIVCFWSLSEFIYLLVGYITSSSNKAYLYLNLSIKNLVAFVVPCFLDQTIMTINFIKKVDEKPERFALLSPALARMLGYSDKVEKIIKNFKEKDAVEVDADGKINIADITNMNHLVETDAREILNG